jgi:hypothetical protein
MTKRAEFGGGGAVAALCWVVSHPTKIRQAHAKLKM